MAQKKGFRLTKRLSFQKGKEIEQDAFKILTFAA